MTRGEVTIYDARGREVQLPSTRRARESALEALGMLGGGGYSGARGDKKSLKTWNPLAGSADSDSLPDLPTLRARSRDLCRNEPLATGAYGTAIDSVVGCGLQLKSVIDREYLEVDDATADAWEDEVERFWRYHACGRRLDLTGELDDVGLSSLVFGSTLESGDVFTLRRFVERPGELLATRVQSIEADRVETPSDLRRPLELPRLDQRRGRRRTIRSGIELDADGMEMAVWIRDVHPGESLGVRGLAGLGDVSSNYQRVMVRNGAGDRLVLHHFDRQRPGQTRGIPWLAPVIEPLKQLGRYTESELAAAVISSYFTVFVKTDFGEGIAPSTEEWKKALGEAEIGLEPAGVYDLLPGQDISTADPKRPNDKFDPFFLAVVRQIAVGLHFPFELLIKHFTASYSASQAAMIEAWRFFRSRRKWLVSTFLQPVYEWVIEEAVARGYLAAPGFFTDALARQAWLGTEWTGDPRGHINPGVEVKALGEQEDRGWITSGEATAVSVGGDWEKKQRRLAREKRTREQLGLQTPRPAPPAPPEPDPDPDAQEALET